MRSALGFARLMLAWTVIIGAAAVLLVGLVVPWFAGATPYHVQTGSMRPSLPPGTLVVVEPVDPEEIGIGTVITYQLESGRPEVTTHRVTEIGINNVSGERTFRTKGDANAAVDADPVRAVQVRGKVWYAVPHIGHVNALVSGPRPLLIAATGMIAYAASMFVGAIRDRRAGAKKKEEDATRGDVLTAPIFVTFARRRSSADG